MRFWVLGYPAADARPSCDVQLSNDDRRGLRTPIRDCARDRRLRLARALDEILLELNAGRLRVAEKIDGTWITHQWVKKAVLLYFRTHDNRVMPGGGRSWFDKVPLRFAGYTEEQFRHDGFRVVPPATVRAGAFIGRNVVLMPSYVNIGAYVGEGTMVDTWATVGSCAQIGKNVHPLRRCRHRRRARAAGQPDDHRGQLLRRRAIGNRRRGHRRGERRDLDGRLHRPEHEDLRSRDREVIYWPRIRS